MKFTFHQHCLFVHHPPPPLVSISSEVRLFSKNILIHTKSTALAGRYHQDDDHQRPHQDDHHQRPHQDEDHHRPHQVPLRAHLPHLQCALNHPGLRRLCRPNTVLDGIRTEIKY